MAKRRSNKHSKSNIRDIVRIARTDVRDLLRSTRDLRLIEDRRLFSFDDVPPLRHINGARHRLTVSEPPPQRRYRSVIPSHVAFKSPETLTICKRRKIRREVMFAKGGAGRRKMRRPRRNVFSNVRC